jgi:hypothetical protein
VIFFSVHGSHKSLSCLLSRFINDFFHKSFNALHHGRDWVGASKYRVMMQNFGGENGSGSRYETLLAYPHFPFFFGLFSNIS